MTVLFRTPSGIYFWGNPVVWVSRPAQAISPDTPWKESWLGAPSWWKPGRDICPVPVKEDRYNGCTVCRAAPRRDVGMCANHAKAHATDEVRALAASRGVRSKWRRETAWKMRCTYPPASWPAIARAFGLAPTSVASAQEEFVRACGARGLPRSFYFNEMHRSSRPSQTEAEFRKRAAEWPAKLENVTRELTDLNLDEKQRRDLQSKERVLKSLVADIEDTALGLRLWYEFDVLRRVAGLRLCDL